ncbi:MAG: long-chain fatty acid--CoA ligase [Fidelibacterota bacterium]|nr:MAG: long-chain fatty acid--CoA ligase [Candidatus Neomarinimicrobiota bacterium]
MAFQTITEMFLQTTSQHADKPLYYHKRRDHWEGLRGKDIRTTVEDLAYGLVSLGIAKGKHAAIVSNNSPRWAMADYGILCTGGATASIYPTLAASQVAYILKHSESRVVFAEDEEQAGKILEVWDDCPDLKTLIVINDTQVTGKTTKGSDRAIISFIDFLELGHEYGKEQGLDFEAMCRDCKPEDVLTLIYTSGTTGEPKGVMLTHHNMISNIEGALEHIQIDETDSLLSSLPLSHSFERMAGHFLAFSRGAAVYYAESIEKVGENMQEAKPTVLLHVPRFYEKVHSRVLESISQSSGLRQKIFWWALAQGKAVLKLTMTGGKPGWWLRKKHGLAGKLVFSKLKERVGGRIRFFVSGAAPLSAEIGEFFASLGMIVLEGYGLTETSPALAVNKLEKFKFGSVGPAIPNVELKIAENGEILAKGPNIMKGYYKDPEASAEVIDNDGWFHTGDIGEFDGDGYLTITDRLKSILVTSGGKNVAPAPLENAMILSPYIEQVMIIGDERNFISALLVPNFENLNTFAEEKSIKSRDRKTLVQDPQVIELFEREVETAMEPFARFERVKKFLLLTREFTIDEGELTPTLKVKRKEVFDHFGEEIESIYANASQ